jgi:hypothetical protein
MNFHRSLLDRIDPQSRVNFNLGYVAPFSTDFGKTAEPEPAVEVTATETETPVVSPPARDMRAIARQLLAPALQELEKFVDDGPERSAMLGEVLSLIEKLGDVLTVGREKRIARLSAEQIALAEQCRVQAEIYAESDKAVTACLEIKRARHAAMMNARSQISSWDSQRDSLGRWPTSAALREYDVKRAALVKAADEAQFAWEACFGEERTLIGIRTAEENKLKKLAQTESTLIQRLSGREWVDPELSLPREAEL